MTNEETNSAEFELSFEEALSALEEIVRSLESGNMSLEVSLSKYEAGAKLLARCFEQLHSAEQKVQLLTQTENGWQMNAFELPSTSPPGPSSNKSRPTKR